jgi:lathosterol oxidase
VEVAIKLLLFLVVMWARYLLVAGLAYMILYVWGKKRFLVKKIQPLYPGRVYIKREIKYSLISIFIFSMVGVGIWLGKKYTFIYADVHQYSIGYFVFTLFMAALVHDTYFYWIHRLMHHRAVYKKVHRVHHLSTNPTPLAAFSFHPLEAVLEAGIFPLLVFTIPMHTWALFIFLFYMVLMNVMGHCGFEFLPSWFLKYPPFNWYNTSTNHNLHHRLAKHNYGLYFNIWDRVMKTNHPST